MARLVLAHPIVAGRSGDHRAWCDEVRDRRAALAASRERAGIVHEAVWVHEQSHLAVLRVDAEDPVEALRLLRTSTDPFDRWYAAREDEVHGGPPLPPGAALPERLTTYVDGEPDELDMFIAVAVPLVEGQTERFRAAVIASSGGDGTSRLRLWRVQQLTIWLQAIPSGDVVIYEAIGDLPEMLRSLAESDDPLVATQRAAIEEWFGIDLATESWPIPNPVRSWSSHTRSSL